MNRSRRTCAIMQPTFLPWLGYFDLIRNSDVFVIYDHVQFEKQSWQQRNRIRTKNGELMLTVPVHHEKGLERRIMDVKIDYSRNQIGKHLLSIQHAYRKARNFDRIFPAIEEILQAKPEYLFQLNVSLIKLGMVFLNINSTLIFSSSLNVQGNQVEALIDVCKKLDANHYLSPVGARVYIEENNLFAANEIELEYQRFEHPRYPQVTYPDFISHLAFIDYLFNIDPVQASNFGSWCSRTNNEYIQ